MKKLASFLLLFLVCMLPLAAQDAFSYDREQKMEYTFSTQKLLIKFHSELTAQQQQELLSHLPAIREVIYNPRFSWLLLDEKTDRHQLKQLLATLKADSHIQYASPVLLNEKGEAIGSFGDEFIVKLKSPADLSYLNAFMAQTATRIARPYEFDPLVYFILADKHSTGNALEMANFFHETGRFQYAEPDFLFFAKKATTDEFYSHQWAISNPGGSGATPDADMDISEAWTITTGNPNIKVAVLDDGVELTHPDLAANLLPGYDATDPNSGLAGDPGGDTAHGTNCAGIIGAVANNNIGIAGIAHHCKLIPIKIYVDYMTPAVVRSSWMATGTNWAVQQGADVISMSLNLSQSSSLVADAIDHAYFYGRNNKGCLTVVAAGNLNRDVFFPAALPNVIAVGATDQRDKRINNLDWGSNYGSELDIMAPGISIYMTDLQGAMGYDSGDYEDGFFGTSAACPHVSAVIALMLSVNPNLTATLTRKILETTADKVGGYYYLNNVPGHPNGSWNEEMGYGRVNAYDAVEAVRKCTDESPHVLAPIDGLHELCQTRSTFSVRPAADADHYVWRLADANGNEFSDTNFPQGLYIFTDGSNTCSAGGTAIGNYFITVYGVNACGRRSDALLKRFSIVPRDRCTTVVYTGNAPDVPINLIPQVTPVVPPTVQVYPNPCADVLHVQLPVTTAPYHIRLTDSRNMTVKQLETTDSGVQLDVADLPADLYFLVIHNGYQLITQKIRLEK